MDPSSWAGPLPALFPDLEDDHCDRPIDLATSEDTFFFPAAAAPEERRTNYKIPPPLSMSTSAPLDEELISPERLLDNSNNNDDDKPSWSTSSMLPVEEEKNTNASSGRESTRRRSMKRKDKESVSDATCAEEEDSSSRPPKKKKKKKKKTRRQLHNEIEVRRRRRLRLQYETLGQLVRASDMTKSGVLASAIDAIERLRNSNSNSNSNRPGTEDKDDEEPTSVGRFTASSTHSTIVSYNPALARILGRHTSAITLLCLLMGDAGECDDEEENASNLRDLLLRHRLMDAKTGRLADFHVVCSGVAIRVTVWLEVDTSHRSDLAGIVVHQHSNDDD